MTSRHPRQRPISLLRRLLLLGAAAATITAASIGTQAAFAQGPAGVAAACAKLATLSNFPVGATQIMVAKFNAGGSTSASGMALPDHCQVQGIINKRVGIDGYPYGDSFEVRLPAPADWNGRFMFQGGGGTEGAVPPAVGIAGTLTPSLARGWAVASQDGGHENTDLPNPAQFFLDPQAIVDHAYRSIDVTTQTAKHLIDAFYGRKANRSYFVGCSTGGRQGMVMSQNFPDYYDGIIAGAPVYDIEAIALSGLWAAKAVQAVTPEPIQKLPDGNPILYPAFPEADQKLFTSALLAACDGLDGRVDGVIDNLRACQAEFDPATFVFQDTGQPLQCTGTKTSACLSPAQINAVKKINDGPRNSLGERIRAPAGTAVREHADNTALGYAYDGGFMAPTGIPAGKIGTPTTTPIDFVLGLRNFPYVWLTPPDPGFKPVRFDFDKDTARLNKSTPYVSYSTSTDISKFRDRGGKIIWYHGASDPLPPVAGTVAYFDALRAENGGATETEKFARLYLVPNMGHCRGGPGTDQFDLLTPLVAWVEQGTAPDRIIGSGTNFTSVPTTRNRPLCPYPQEARYTGPILGDLADASNYGCVAPK
jgi:Tannase and feruloyl esterase